MKNLILSAGLGLLAMMAPAAAMDAKLFPYPASANYCPEGLQPVRLGGVICCGVPNQAATYSQYQRHPVSRAYHRPHVDYGSKSPGGHYGSKSPRN
ncbi:hypothetical protein OB2597_15505 [Pseudooceanicola batsensis HTCC2597]|uniref:Uncharacterized protein n=1 Tax=Pseudooceanicola batsensis (strain ATCC BAA-863 / DSM 15984 / KCTC 12145 / HTCC2597) TaxID=252305 RepID=A3TYY3_PSEBH|nr:hypothetical protein [Pseudooceanicola batsensis]EAQ02801.1 hypothetical protein OB2597_15505 [Pseudooceanicola batsensis HTCC2597]